VGIILFPSTTLKCEHSFSTENRAGKRTLATRLAFDDTLEEAESHKHPKLAPDPFDTLAGMINLIGTIFYLVLWIRIGFPAVPDLVPAF
jgi:hypothetical protein